MNLLKLMSAVLLLSLSLSLAQETVRMTFAGVQPATNHEAMTLEEFARLAGEYSGGRIQIDTAVGGILGGERDIAEGIQLGTIDGAVLGGILQNFDPAMAILEFPFLFKNEEHVRAVMEGEVGEQIRQRLIDTTGIRILDYIMRTPRQLTTNRPINSLEDLQGLKIRVPEMEAHLATWSALGASPTPLAFPEVYNALQLGVVDGQENPYGVIVANRFYEVVDHLVLTEHLVGFMLLVMSNTRFEALEPELQDAILRAATDARAYNDQVLAELNAEWESVLFDTMEVSRPDMEPWREAASDVYQRFTRHEGFEDLYRAIVEVGEDY